MNDQILMYIVTIAEEKSLFRAAAKLFISQPALSRALQKIEEEVGEILFYRTSRGLFPTAAGEYFIRNARRILRLYDDVHNEFCSFNSLHKGILTVAAPTRLCSIVLPDSLRIFKSRYPNVTVRITDVLGSQTEEEVAQAKADLGMIYLPARQDGFTSLPLFDISSCIVLPKDHPANGKAYYSEKIGGFCLDVEDLRDESFILPKKGTNSRRFAERIFRSADLVPTIAIEALNLDIIIGLVSAGLGVSVIPWLSGLMYEKFFDRIKVYNLDEKYDSMNTVAVIYNGDASLTCVTREYLSILSAMEWEKICPGYVPCIS